VRGQSQANAFFTDAAFSYFKTKKNSDAEKSLEKSLKEDYERELIKLYQHVKLDTLINTEFFEQCNKIFPEVNWKVLAKKAPTQS
jgi:hypothetical protein